MLAGDSGELSHSDQVLESVDESVCTFFRHHLLHRYLFASLIADRFHIIGRKLIGICIDLHELIDL